MTRKEEVIKAIEFKSPDYIPRWFINKDQMKGDIANYWLFPLGKGEKTEWGYEWITTNLDNGTMGIPKNPTIPTWGSLKKYKFPDPWSDKKYKDINKFKLEAGDRYQIASLGITGFNNYTFLRGFENGLIDFKLERRKATNLLKRLFEIENKVILSTKKYGFDGIMFYDDWGMQKNLIISPELWREIFKPFYMEQFELVHKQGYKVWFHSCGDITEIIPDFYEIGVDVMNMGQPNVVDLDYVSGVLKGKQCFLMPISYQTVSIKGTPEDIKNEARRLYSKLGSKKGGLIGWIEEYSSVGMPERNYQACTTAFNNIMD